MNGRAATTASIVALTVAGALPGLVLLDVIDERASLIAAAIAALVAAVAASVVARRHSALVAATFVGGALAVSVTAAAAWPGESGRSLLAATSDGLLRGWSSLVTTPVPSSPNPRLLIPVAVVVWAAVFGAVVSARRGTARLVPLVPALVALVLASVAAGSAQAAPVSTALIFVAASAVVSVARGPRPMAAKGRAASLRPVALTAVASVGLATLGAALAGPALADSREDTPFDPRDHLDPPTLPTEAENPLDLVASWLQHPDQVLFTVRSDQPLTTRLVALDAFDGASWTIGGTWITPGSRITPPARPRAQRQTVTVEIEVPDDGLSGPFLPSTADVTQVTGLPVIVQPQSGSLAAAGGTAAGGQYSLTADLVSFAALSNQEFNSLPAATGPEADLARRLDSEPPDELVESANAATAGRTTPMDQAISINNFFVNGGFSQALEPRGGHAYYHILQTLGVTFEGSSEQYAAAFAVYGRIVGLPTRLVVGFGPGTETEPGVYTVTAGDVRVWPEVLFDGVGWVWFNPTPSERSAEQTEDVLEPSNVGDREEVPQAPPTTLPPAPDPVPDPPPADDVSDSGSGSTWVRVALAVAAAVVALLLLGALAIVAVKRRRTSRRRRDGDARAQVLGAWHDVLDRLVESDGTAADDKTVEDVVRENDRADAPLGDLYMPVVRAAYGRDPIDAADASAVWAVRDRFVRARRRDLGLARRCRAALDVRPVLRPSGRRAPDRRESQRQVSS